VIDIGTTLNQRFLLEKELGRGGMGAVYSANDDVLDRKVAIKVLKEHSGDEVGKKLRLEAQIAARLVHENVVRIYDFGQADGTYFLVMEAVIGTSFSKRWRHLELAERLRILAEVADALDYAHHQGVVHRDVKPGNVLLTAADAPKLSDFGLSMLVEQGDNSNVVRGTPHYMSPEQTRAGRLDYRTDLYSLGVMVYESATGSVPFTGTSLSIMSQHVGAEPERPRARNKRLAPELESLILSLLAKKPDNRPGSGAVVAAALRQEVERAREQDQRDAAVGLTEAPTVTVTAVSKAVPFTEALAGPAAASANGPGAAPSLTSSGPQTPLGHVTEAVPSPEAASLAGSAPPATPAAPPAAAVRVTVSSTGGMIALVRAPLARKMLEVVLAEPILITPDERYLYGHYLAYLLGGSRRRGVLMRRPLEPRNADRSRLLLALTYALLSGPTEDAIRDAISLLDQRIEVRPALSPVVVAKYLACRDTVAKRRLLRQARKAIGEASAYAQKRLIDEKGVLNPGLIPQRLDDLRLIAPVRTEVDDVLVERWNRVAEVWHEKPEFRNAVLRYATVNAHRDPASTCLWPEVVYPLIERARWHRRIRSRTESIWDYIWGGLFHLPDAGVRLDRALDRAVPAPLAAQLDDSLNLMIENPKLDDEEGDPFAPPADEMDRLSVTVTGSQLSLAELEAEHVAAHRNKSLIHLTDAKPLRFLQGDLHELWKEALQALQSQPQTRPGAKPATHRHVPVGPYRLTVIPSIRGRSAGQIAIQGMHNKQIELTTPTVRTKGSAGKPLLAIWHYLDNSLVIVHLDFKNATRYILWHAPKSHQLNYDDPAELNRELYGLGMELPDQLDQVLSRWFKPRSRT
jgi:eukaryotic-like serine/threonine-protein kinase